MPDGTVVANIPDEVTPEQAKAKIQQMNAPAPTGGVIGELGASTLGALSGMRTGLGAIFGNANEAAKAGEERRQEIAKQFTTEDSLEKIKAAYNAPGGGLLSAAKTAVGEIPTALAGAVPIMAEYGLPRIAGGIAGAALAGPAGAAIGQQIGGGLGLGLGYLSHIGSNVEEQAAEQKKQGKPVDVSTARAAAFAVPETALDVAHLIPTGAKAMTTVFGPEVAALLGQGEKSAAEKLAASKVQQLAQEKLDQQGFWATIGKGTVEGAKVGVPLMVAQTALSRAQAGQDLLSDEAMAQYGSAATSGFLGAPLGILGARGEQAEAVAAVEGRKREAQQAAAKLQREAEAHEAEKLEAFKQSPEYEQQVIDKYLGLERQRKELEAQKIPVSAETPAADNLANSAIQKQIDALKPQINEAATEYTRLKGLREEAEKKLGTVSDQVGPITRDELQTKAPDLLEELEQKTADLDRDPTNSYTLQDIHELAEKPESHAGLHDIIAERTGFDGQPIEAADLLASAHDKKIDPSSEAFKDFLAKTTGTNDLNNMSQPQLHAAFKALSELPDAVKPVTPVVEKQGITPEELHAKLAPFLKKFGLGDIDLQIVKGLQEEGNYGSKVIQIALDANKPIGVLRHEVIHGLKALGFFTDQQWKLLEHQAETKWIDQFLKQRNVDGLPLKDGEQSRYDAYVEDYKGDMAKVREEAIADAFRHFDVNGAPSGVFGAMLNGMRNFFARIKNAFNGAGFQTSEDLFRKIEAGKLVPEGQEAAGQMRKSMRTLTDEVPLSTRRIMESNKTFAQNDLGLNIKKKKGAAGENTVREVAKALNDKTLREFEAIDPKDRSQEASDKLANAMADEVAYQLGTTSATGTGTGWYSSNYPKALQRLANRFPELMENKHARSVFSALVAITSNGERVDKNIKNAIELYAKLRDGKPLVAMGVRRATALHNNLFALQNLLAVHKENFQKEMTREITVRDLNAYLRSKGEKPDNSYTADTKIPAAAIYFGPKLGAFFSNLSGSEGYLTMDLWWSRTINRMRGQLMTNATESSISRFREMMDKPDASRDEVVAATIPFRDKYKEYGYKTELEHLAKSKEPNTKAGKDAWFKKAKAAAGDAYPQLEYEHQMEKMANTIYKNEYEMLQEAPFGAGDRKFMYEAARKAQNILSDKGVNLSLADIQAALWYYEKRLYAKLTGREADDIGYEEAIIAQSKDGNGRARPSVVFNRQPDRGNEPTGEVQRTEQNGQAPDQGARASLRTAIRSYRERNEAAPDSHTREGFGDGAGVRVLGRETVAAYKPTEDFKNTVGEFGHRSPTFYEMQPQDADVFQAAIAKSKEDSPYGAAVYVYPEEAYADMRKFMTQDGKAGFALKGNDIVSVFSSPEHKGAASSMLQLAVQEGGRKLDAFDTVLPNIYYQNGFKVVGRMKWNEDYIPDGWNKQTFKEFNKGEPDVVYMAYDPEESRTPDVISPDQYYDDPDALAKAQDDAVTKYVNEGTGYGTKSQAQGTGKLQTQAGQLPQQGGVRRSIRLLDDETRAKYPDLEKPVEGLPATVKVDGKDVTFGPYTPAREAAIFYGQESGIPYRQQESYHKLDPDFSKKLAATYLQMADDPLNPEVARAYKAWGDETIAQYKAMMKTGIKIEFMPNNKDPYGNPRNAILDVLNNNHLYVFPADGGFGSKAITEEQIKHNPALALTDIMISGRPARLVEVFRATHDFFGHIKEGFGFRAEGEENAFQSHVRMYSPEAARAMTAGTRGQNSVVNFGPYAEANRKASGEETKFADQKIGLMPEWATNTNIAPDVRKSLRTAPDTPEFKQFFGKSTIVDERGQPKVMYHGLAKDTTDFTRKTERGAPIFLTDDADFAGRFAKDSFDYVARDPSKYLTKEQLNDGIKRAIKAIKKDYGNSADAQEMIKSISAGDLKSATPDAKEYLRSEFKDMLPTGPHIMPLYVRAERPFDYSNPAHIKRVLAELTDGEDLRKDLQRGSWETIESEAVQDAIKFAGFDSFYVKEHGVKNLAVFDPTQVKSATGNIGTYDRFNPDVRASKRTVVTDAIQAMPNGQSILDSLNKVSTARDEKTYAQRITSAIAPDTFSKLRQAFVHKYNQMSVNDRRIAERMGGIDRLADQSAEAAALESDKASGIAAAALGVGNRMGGIPVFRNGFTTVSDEGGTIKGAVAIFAPLAKYGDSKIYQAYQLWAGAKRAERLSKEDREKLFSAQDIANGKALEKMYPEFNDIQKEWIKYSDGLVKYMVDTGQISEEQGKRFTEHSDYLPFYRQMDGENTVGPKIFQNIAGVKTPKTLKGGEAPLGDFMENIVRNTQAAIAGGLKNEAGRRAIRDVMDLGEAERLNAVSSGPDVVTILEKGQPVSYRVADPLLVDAMRSLSTPEMPLLSFLSKPANFLRSMVTKDPAFIIANMMKHSMYSYMLSGSDIKPITGTIKNFAAVMGDKSETYKKLLNAGVLSTGEFGRGIEASGKALEKSIGEKGGAPKTAMEMAASPFTGIWHYLEKASEAHDAAVRISVYEDVMKKTGNEAEALHQALEVLNFNRKGNNPLVRIITATVPFLNAKLQGLDIMYRSGIRPSLDPMSTNAEKLQQKTSLIRMGMLLGLSSMYAAAVMGNPEYENQNEEVRDLNWIIPGVGKFPIPFELGVLFKTIPEHIYRYYYGTDTAKDLQRVSQRALLDTLSFNPIPQAIMPALEAKSNYSLFTQRPIVGPGMERLEPEYQMNAGTSKVAEQLGKLSGTSPMLIDHLLQGYTGTMGMYFADVADAVFNQYSDVKKPSLPLEQMPVIKRFLVDPNAKGTTTAFYELKDEVDKAVATAGLLEKQGSPEYAEFIQKHQKELSGKEYVQGVNSTLKEFTDAANAIRRSKEMTADEKRDKLAEITKAQNQLLRNVYQAKKMFTE